MTELVSLLELWLQWLVIESPSKVGLEQVVVIGNLEKKLGK
jgi:hypothetical protein